MSSDRTSDAGGIAAFVAGLTQAGWTEGQNLTIEWREAHGLVAEYAKLADELIRLPVEIIVAESSESIRAVAAATSRIPIVMMAGGAVEGGVTDPVSGSSVSLARPAGNVTGTFTPQPIAKRLELLKTVFPKLVRVGMLHTLVTGYPTEQVVLDSEAAARSLGMEPIDMAVSGPAQGIDAAFIQATASGIEALVETTSWVLIDSHFERVVQLALSAQLPGMFPSRGYVAAGGLMSYGFNGRAIYRRTATYVDRILRGASPGQLPIELPTTFDFVVNASTAQAFGVTLPADAATQVTEWIE